MKVFSPDKGERGKKLHFICIFDVAEWEGCCVEWLSPIGLSLKYPGVSRAHFSIMMTQVSEILPLLTLAARHGFWLLNITAIKAIAERINVEVDVPLNSLDLFDLCWHTVRKVLHPCSPSVILDAVQHRLITMARSEKVSAHEVFMGLDEGLQVLSRDDEDDVRKNQKKQRDVESKTKAFSDSYRAAVGKHRPLAPKPKAKPKGSSRGASASSSQRVERVVPQVPDGAITQVEAKQLLAPGFVLYGVWVCVSVVGV